MTISKDSLALLAALRNDGVRLSLDGDDLLAEGAMTDDAAGRIRAHKSEIVAFLRSIASADTDQPVSVAVDPENRFAPFPLNETQQAYWLGRDSVFEAGDVAIHVFVEMADPALDLARAEQAWRRLVAHHDMLRALVLSDGRQQVLAEPPEWHLPVEDWRALPANEADRRLAALRDEMSHYRADLAQWPTWRLVGVRPAGDRVVLMLSLDCWAIDGRSIQILAADFAQLYADPATVLPSTDLTFRDYVLALEIEQQSPAYRRALEYWRDRVRVLPAAPPIPRRDGQRETKPRFVRHARTLPAAVHRGLKDAAARRGLTLANVLIGCYAEALGRWSGTSQFTLNIPRWNRHPLHADVDQIVGEFATFELLAVDLAAGRTFADRVHALQRQFAEDLNHDIVSGIRILREWRKQVGADPGVAMPYVFTHEPDLFGEGRTRAWMASFGRIAPVVEALTQTPQVWIDAQYHDVDGDLLLVWDALENVFPDGLVADMFAAYADLAHRLGADDAAWLEACPIGLPAGQTLVRDQINTTDAPVERPVFARSLDDHAERRPTALAVIDHRGSIDWQGLKRRVDALAETLAAMQVGLATPIAVVMHKGAEQVIAALALHRLGAICTPLDPDSPSDRLAYMLRHCRAPIVLTTADLADAIIWPEATPPETLVLVERDAAPATANPPPVPALRHEDLHCILYTSGSTGVPKGVMVPSGALLNVIDDGLPRFAVTADSRLLSLTPLHHDLSLFDLYAAVSAGACVVLPDPQARRDPAHWLSLIEDHGVTGWNSVPAMMTMLLDYCEGQNGEEQPVKRALASLRTVILGGDWVPVETPRRLKRWAPGAVLTSIGGPTETTIWNITYRVEEVPDGWASIPYGTPTANNKYYVLTDSLEDCPDWTPGELCCTGAGVTAGYLDDPVRTAESFVTHPRTGERLYRTGDLGRYRPDGLIEFLGRRDNQINLNGYRMELGEIETCLAGHPAVAQAVAVPRRDGRVVRSVVVSATLLPGETATEDGLLDFVHARLPRQMHPAALRLRSTFPLTANGKVDRQALETEAGESAEMSTSFVPATDAERLVTQAWRQVLGADPVGPDVSFFAAGGDSISAIGLYNALLAGRVDGATVLTVFRSPTVRALADIVAGAYRQAAPSLPDVVPTVRDRIAYPAMAAQTRLWFEEQLTETGSLYNLSFNLRLDGTIDPAAIRRALGQVVAAWETLRTALRPDEDGRPVQMLLPPWLPALPVSDVAGDGDPEAALMRIGRRAAEMPFDLAEGRPLRAHLVSIGPQRAHLVLVVHHAACDGWSFNLLVRALVAALKDEPVGSPVLAPIDYARWERRAEVAEAITRQTAWWHRKLQHLPPGTEIDLARRRPPLRAAMGAMVTRRLTPTKAERIVALARRHDATAYLVLLTGLALVLRRWTDQDRIVIGSHVALRDRPELADLPGMLVNNLALDLDFSASATFEDALAVGRTAFMDAWQNGLAPFNRVVQSLGGWHDTTRHPLYGITFTHESIGADTAEAGAVSIAHASPFVARSPLDLDLAMAETPDGHIVLKAVYNVAVLDETVVAALMAALEVLVDEVCDRPAIALAAIPVTDRTVDEVLQDGQGPRRPIASDSSPVALFDQQAHEHPAEPALLSVDGRGMTTFAGLQARSCQAAVAFQALGLSPGGTAAILCPRGPDMVAAMLATWRCGAHFVALSPDDPPDRIAYILDDAGVQLVVADDWADTEFAVSRPTEWSACASLAAVTAKPDEIAALIYTSGSTGRPNGVEFNWRALHNRLRWQWETWPYEEREPCIARTAVAFVDYLAELFGPLLAGHPVAVLDAATAADPARLAAATAAIRPRRLLTVPSLLDLLLDETGGEPAVLRMSTVDLWTVSGEPMPLDTVRRFFARLPDSRLLNLYGSSEAGADVTCAELRPDHSVVTVGIPLDNVEVHVVDPALTPLPAGVPGQLLVAGDAVARGYRNRPDLTAERFPLWQGRKVCLTGDRGMRRADGSLQLLGRLDRQVKIRGQRVDLDEVQAVLAGVDGVGEAAVMVDRRDNVSSILALVTGAVSVDVIRRRLKSWLPSAAQPERTAVVERLPRLASGKIDYRAIPDVIHQSARNDGLPNGEPPGTPVEKTLAGLWQEVLGEMPTSRQAGFGDQGGHSIAAARLAARIRRDFAVEFPLRWVFERGTLQDMAAAVEELQGPADAAAELEEMIL